MVVGAGAAGFLAAIFAARAASAAGHRHHRILLLERTRDGGRKILMSGGGRCNVLPSELDPARFVTASSPNTMKKILLSWPLREQRRFFEEDLEMPLALEEETGKLFPVSNRAKDVRDRLRALAERSGAEMRFECAVEGLEPPAVSAEEPITAGGSGARNWRVLLAGGSSLPAARVILATGGLSVPATGSDGTGLRIVRKLGHTVHDTYPALTPLTAQPHRHAALSGVSLPVTIEAPTGRRTFLTRGGFLFTHKGYSGPAVLNVSHLAVRARHAGGPRQPIDVSWSPLTAEEWDRTLQKGTGAVVSLLRARMPARLAETLLDEAGVDAAATTSTLRREDRLRLVGLLTRYPLPWTSDEGYSKAEVTGGGVALDEVNARTLESKLCPGLYLCGEILDAFGPIGGYNFAWAWATGRAAGLAAVSSMAEGS
ncbi:MAG TPA: aminoacetone oxidase family FAD-binding enzyme [Candidatus Eisenbacteria bacterium]|nr:aminoacetone oxidase family FAD-binding enzyme [Candidatus Eisenbacteria bacterium]